MSLRSIDERSLLWGQSHKFNLTLRVHLGEEISITLHFSTLECKMKYVIVGGDSSCLWAGNFTFLGLCLLRRSLCTDLKSCLNSYISCGLTFEENLNIMCLVSR